MAARWEFDAIGTRWCIETAHPLDIGVRAAVSALVDRFDREWSRFRDDSVIARLARAAATGPATLPAPPDAAPMLDAYAALADATAGAVNPLVGDALARRGYDATLSLVDRGAEAAPTAWRDLLTWDAHGLHLSRAATIDVGALGKGRLVDRVADLLASAIGSSFVVDASGDLVVRGRAERIGLEHPFDPTRAIGVWELSDGALCASATNRRRWGVGAVAGDAAASGLHHILDARTGAPVRAYAATWARADDAMTADAIATALFFEGGAELASRWNVAWVRMTTDGAVEWSPGCDADVFVGR